MAVSIIKKLKDIADPALDAVKKNMDLKGMQEFATTVKRGKDKTYRPEKTIVRPSEEVEESLAEKLSRATNKELTIDDKKATTIMPAPGKFFNQQSKDFKPPIDKMAREALVKGDPDPIFGMYIDVNAVKNATEKVYQNLFVSGRTAQKSEGLKFDKGEQKFIEYSKAKASPPVSRALPYDGPKLLDSSKLKGLEEKERNLVVIDQMKKNFELNTGEKGKEININLLQPDRFNVIIDGNKNRLDHPIVAVHYPTKTKDGHYYTLDTQLVGPVYMKRNTTKDPRTNKAQSPNLKPATVGNIETGLGKQIGVIRISKQKKKEDDLGYTDHPLYDYIEVDGTAASSPDAPMSLESKFNQGGAVQMQKQMEMFNDGGLKEEGGTKDPVSGNDVPSGSLQEEVRDDIDAKLSPGEFVFPADVVRFIGLEKLMLMRDKAKKGLARMEEMGQMGNSEEATIDDDVPFGMEDLIIVAGPPDNEMNKGGMPTYANGGAGRFEQLVGQPMFESTTKVFKNDQNQTLYIPFVRGQPVYQPPPGYREVTQEEQQQEATTPNVASTKVDPVTETGSGELGGGPDIDDVGYADLSEIEQVNMGLDALGLGPTGAFGQAVQNIGPDFVGAGMAALTGVKGYGTLGQLGVSQLDPSAKPAGVMAKERAEKDLKDAKTKARSFLSMSPQEQAQVRAKSNQDIANRATKSYMDSVGASKEMRDDTVSVTGTIGGIPSPLSVDVVTGVVTDPMTGDVIGGREAQDARASARAERYGFDEDRASPGALGGKTGPSPDQAKEAAIGMAENEAQADPDAPDPETADDDSGGGVEGSKGGFIPKRKKQKKMKRGGLASR
jgi:hypothetical protein